MLLSVLLLLLMMVCGIQSTHYHGTMMTYYPKEIFSNGSVSVILHFKSNSQTCTVDLYSCTGNCGTESTIIINAKIESSASWCQTERITTRLLPNNSPFQLSYAGGTWFSNLNGIGSWRAVTSVELRERSDTMQINSSPQTNTFPVLRVPSNCYININLLAFDPDGDVVRCRYADLSLTECASPCTPPPVLALSSTCTLSFSGTSTSNEGLYAVQMVMEDFPRQSITLTHNNGSHIVKSTSEAISQIPIQFGFLVDPAVPSCTKGYYLPGFLSPTPDHGAQFYTHVDKALEINIRASASHSVISELLYSGPSSVVKTSFGSGEFSLTWTPSAAYEEESHPICFAIQASYSSSVYQSELRCVVVTVKKKPKPIFLNALRMKISTTLSLKDNRDVIENLLKEELLRKGFPPGISVRLMNNSSMIVK